MSCPYKSQLAGSYFLNPVSDQSWFDWKYTSFSIEDLHLPKPLSPRRNGQDCHLTALLRGAPYSCTIESEDGKRKGEPDWDSSLTLPPLATNIREEPVENAWDTILFQCEKKHSPKSVSKSCVAPSPNSCHPQCAPCYVNLAKNTKLLWSSLKYWWEDDTRAMFYIFY